MTFEDKEKLKLSFTSGLDGTHPLFALLQGLGLDLELLLDVVVDLEEHAVLVVDVSEGLAQSLDPRLRGLLLLFPLFFQGLVARPFPALDHAFLELPQPLKKQ